MLTASKREEVIELKDNLKSQYQLQLHTKSADSKKYDPVKMKKNLDDNKKRLAEKTGAAEVLQKSLGKTKSDNAELLKKVAELEARVAELEPVVEEEVQEEKEAA